jgi:uncharacterized membrane protein YfcA
VNPALAFLLLIAAGVGAGVTGSVAGLASIVSFPALLALGLSPVAANVTNTVALVMNSVGSVSASRQDLRGQGPRLRFVLVVGLFGGGTGSILLLVTPPTVFGRVAPALIAFGSLAVLFPRRRHLTAQPGRDSRLLAAGVFVTAVYGGYFGAAAGVLMLALLLATTTESVARANATKNAVMGIANASAALIFIVSAPVRWTAAVPLGLGLFVGGRLGPPIVRRTSGTLTRVVVAIGGLCLAGYLALSH